MSVSGRGERASKWQPEVGESHGRVRALYALLLDDREKSAKRQFAA